MSSMLLRSPRLLFHLHSHHVSCVGFCLRSKELAVRGFSQDLYFGTKATSSGKLKKDRRFVLPGRLGQSWQVDANYEEMCLTQVVDYLNMSAKRLHVKIDTCPYLITQTADVKELFLNFIHPDGPQSIIMLSYEHFEDEELGMKYFYVAAKMLYFQIQLLGHYANFVNPYTGRPHDDYSPLLKLDLVLFKQASEMASASQRLKKDKFKSNEECLYIKHIKPHKNKKIGLVYSTAPVSLVERALI